MFAERPFSSLLRNLGNSIGVPEKNAFSIKQMIDKPEIRDRLASIGANFLFGHKAEEYVLNDGSVEKMYTLYLLDDQAELTGGVVEEAKANLGPQGTTSAGQPIVNLSMNSDGARKWAIMTGSNIGRQVAIVLDNKVHMAPNIREKISGGGTLIEGFANIDEAKAKANPNNVDPIAGAINATQVINVYNEDDFDLQFEALTQALAEEDAEG